MMARGTSAHMDFDGDDLMEDLRLHITKHGTSTEDIEAQVVRLMAEGG